MSPPDRPPFATQEQWDDRYRSASRIWSGRPNPHLVTEVADLAPGTALDAGDPPWRSGSRGATPT